MALRIWPPALAPPPLPPLSVAPTSSDPSMHRTWSRTKPPQHACSWKARQGKARQAGEESLGCRSSRPVCSRPLASSSWPLLRRLPLLLVAAAARGGGTRGNGCAGRARGLVERCRQPAAAVAYACCQTMQAVWTPPAAPSTGCQQCRTWSCRRPAAELTCRGPAAALDVRRCAPRRHRAPAPGCRAAAARAQR